MATQTKQNPKINFRTNIEEMVELKYDTPLQKEGQHGPYFLTTVDHGGVESTLFMTYHVGVYVSENFGEGDIIKIGKFEDPERKGKNGKALTIWKVNDIEVPYVAPDGPDDDGSSSPPSGGSSGRRSTSSRSGGGWGVGKDLLSMNEALGVLDQVYAKAKTLEPNDAQARCALVNTMMIAVTSSNSVVDLHLQNNGQSNQPQQDQPSSNGTSAPAETAETDDMDLATLENHLASHNVSDKIFLAWVASKSQGSVSVATIRELPAPYVTKAIKRFNDDADAFVDEISGDLN